MAGPGDGPKSSAPKGNTSSQPHFITKWMISLTSPGQGRIIPTQGRAANILSNNLAFCTWRGKIDFLNAVLCKLEVFCSSWERSDDILLETQKWNHPSFVILIAVKVTNSLQCPKVFLWDVRSRPGNVGKVWQDESYLRRGRTVWARPRGFCCHSHRLLVNLDPPFSGPPEIWSLCFPCFRYMYSLPKASHPVRWLEWVCSFQQPSFKSQYINTRKTRLQNLPPEMWRCPHRAQKKRNLNLHWSLDCTQKNIVAQPMELAWLQNELECVIQSLTDPASCYCMPGIVVGNGTGGHRETETLGSPALRPLHSGGCGH